MFTLQNLLWKVQQIYTLGVRDSNQAPLVRRTQSIWHNAWHITLTWLIEKLTSRRETGRIHSKMLSMFTRFFPFFCDSFYFPGFHNEHVLSLWLGRNIISVIRLHPNKKILFFLPCLTIEEGTATLVSPRECLHLISCASRDSGEDGGGVYVAAGTFSEDWRYMRG